MSNPVFVDYFSEFRNIPKEWDKAQNQLNWYLNNLNNFTNSKTSGIYTSAEAPSGNQLYTSATSYDILRKAYSIGGLLNGTTTIPHGINTANGFTLFDLRLSANDTSSGKSFCLQYYSISPTEDIVIYNDHTNIYVVTKSSYTNFNKCYLFIEYILGAVS